MGIVSHGRYVTRKVHEPLPAGGAHSRAPIVARFNIGQFDCRIGRDLENRGHDAPRVHHERYSPRMSRFKDQLEELSKYSDKFPGARLRFDVPISSLKPSAASERRLVEGEWKAQLVQADGTVMIEATGASGEHSMEWLVTQLRNVTPRE